MDHVVSEYADIPEHKMEKLVWRNPASSLYCIVYVRCFNTLFVMGDCYEAAYQWGQEQTLRWMGDLNYDYFLGKCRASAQGSLPQTWCPDIAQERLKEMYDEGTLGDLDKEELDEGMCACDTQESMVQWLSDSRCSDAWEMGDIGMMPDIMSYLHWVGLKRAWAWLDKQKEKTS